MTSVVPNAWRLQIAQIRESDGDLIFGLPSIIGEESEPLPDEAMGIFFSRSFESSVDLYRSLFLHGNFLCAPSVLARKSFFETYGRFKLGLIQLQDFEMWIRACRLGANLAMYPNPYVAISGQEPI